MITRVEIDGFKTFHDFSLDMAPFQVIIGANGTGKSNLFDALRLLSRLADTDLRSAFQDLRGEANELFSILPDGQSSSRIQLAVEMLVAPQIQDSWGAEATLPYTRLRYALEIRRSTDELGLERLYVTHESLTAIARKNDEWIKKHIGEHESVWLPPLKSGRSAPFISTDTAEGSVATIYLHQDGRKGRRASVAEKAERTVLSGVTNTEFPHVLAAREELRSWKFLQLNPEVLRQPSSMVAHQFVSADGSNLPSTLARMQAEDTYVMADVSRDLANLVPGITEVVIEQDQPRNRYIMKARTQDGTLFSSRVLSDGTLRLLTLVALKNDSQHRGVLCFEEPENGVHPFRLQNMVQLLRDLATDFADPEQREQPLRQLLVNTHSPTLVSQLVAQLGIYSGAAPELTFAHTVMRVQPGSATPPLRVTRMTHIDPSIQRDLNVGANGSNGSDGVYTVNQVIEYLHSADADKAVAILTHGLVGD
ncbi:MAG: AAA family ATPase [Chloroflexota bacterium]|nr:AAA family ATPase [Chloroflexota bacterium]